MGDFQEMVSFESWVALLGSDRDSEDSVQSNFGFFELRRFILLLPSPSVDQL